MSGLLHVVLFRFAPGTGADARAEVTRRFLALADVRRDGRRYLRRVSGGPDSSPEGLGHGWDVGFVVEFEDEADRPYYLGAPFSEGPGDPDHAAFTAFVGPLVDDVLVFDVAGQPMSPVAGTPSPGP